MARIRVEPNAWDDLLKIVGYLADVAGYRLAARAIAEEFERKCEAYARQPLMGDLRDDLGDDLRSFPFGGGTWRSTNR